MPLIDVTPTGTVNMGNNCSETFSAKINDNLFDEIYWYLQPLDPNTNLVVGSCLGLGRTSTDTVHFSLNHNQLHSLAINGKLGFYVACIKSYMGNIYPAVWSNPNGTPIFLGNSNTIVMDFTGPSCVGLHSVSLNPSEFVGGDGETDKTVTINVTLDGVAPPGGRLVTLEVVDNNLIKVARLVAGNTFLIPAGQQTGSLSFFLGTKKLTSKLNGNKRTKDFTVKVIVESINNSVGYANGTVTS